ncbi:MAG: hypothetical protein PHQ12_10625 [Chthoniobacteraceae bacterium]|nr:hypothetical protein [Chthoniobacteraceae bacterium]
MKRLRNIGLLVAAWVLLLTVIWMRPLPPLSVPANVFPPPAPLSGAAVFYNQAFAAIPSVSSEEWKCLYAKGDEPLDRNYSRQIIERFGPVFDLLAQGANEPGCAWGLDLNQKETFLHLSKVARCTRALILRARLRLDDGNSAGAADDLLMGMRLNRQAGEPSLYPSTLNRISCESLLLPVAAANLPRFDAAALQKLADGIAAFPPAHSLADCIPVEKRRLPLAVYARVSELRDCVAKGPWYAPIAVKVGSIVTQAPSLEIYRATPEALAAWTRAMEPNYDALERILRLPFSERESHMDALLSAARAGTNPLADCVFPFSLSACRKEIQTEAMWTIFRTALEARLHGTADLRARIAALPDPFDATPLKCRDVKAGVEIQLQGAPSQPPVMFTVGLDWK